MTRLLRKLRELFAGLYSAITMPRWNPYGGQAREELGLPLACICCGDDVVDQARVLCEECRILAREGVVRVPEAKGEPQWFEPGFTGEPPQPGAPLPVAGRDCLGCGRDMCGHVGLLCLLCEAASRALQGKVVKGPWS